MLTHDPIPSASPTYREQLQSWCILRSHAQTDPTAIACFRRYSDAEAHLQVLQRQNPGLSYRLEFMVKRSAKSE